jgi:beta-glucuronidase
MKRSYFNLILGFLTLIFPVKELLSQEQPLDLLQNIESREKQTLDGAWKIIVDPLENGYYNHRYQPHEEGYFKNKKMTSPSDLIEYDFDTDGSLMVPGDWNTQWEKLYYYEGTIWYKKSFDFEVQQETRSFVYFEAVNYEAKVYLNGELLGSHEGGFTPFQFEVTGKLKAKDNFLILKVDNKRKKDGIPTLNSDWWNYGGITRSVHLVMVPTLHISDYTITLSKDGKNIQGQIVTKGNANKNKILITIPELKKKIELPTESDGTAHFSFKAKPELWSPENPKLYKVELQIGEDTIVDHIGFRTIETKGYDILLNGKSIFLKGISIHEEAPYKTGRVTTDEEILTLLQWTKELGCNYIRLAHYPHSEKMVKEAEKMGILIWSEIPVYWTVSFGNELTYKLAERQLEEMISRDKNRAAIILWGVANETPLSQDRFVFLKKLADKARSLDATRLITAALDTQSEKDGAKVIDDPLGAVVDVIGINSYCGWYYGKPSDCSGLKWENPYNKPMIMSEMGGGALAGLHGEANERWTEEYLDDVYKYNLEMLDNIPFLRGMTPWILMDFRSARRHLKNIQKDFNRKGLISEQGIRKKAFYRLQDYYKNKELN